MKILAAVLLIILTGCMGHNGRQSVQQGQPPRTESVPVRPAPDEPRAEVIDLPHPPKREENTRAASNNATQQSLNGLGLQMGKMAEVLQASLLRMEANFTAAVKVQNEMRADLSAKAELKARVEAVATAQAKLDARIDAAVNASLQGQAGLNNRIDQVSTTAGRDAITTTQFTEPMERLMTKMVSVIEAIIIGGVVVCVTGFFMGMRTIIKVFVGLIQSIVKHQAEADEREDAILANAVKGHPNGAGI